MIHPYNLTKAAATLSDRQAQKAQYQEAQAAYSTALKLDPADKIVKDNLQQLANYLESL